ncbi:MAG: hypothetical protein JW928_02225 [Candidatus Aureabacteria bacterium]|nr:hypothetical protein [Candidatus Auribacterota bacterium]
MTLFEFGKEVVCDCGCRVTLQHEEWFEDIQEIFKSHDLALEEEHLSRLKQISDKIAFLILNTDCRPIDIELEKKRLKELIKKLFPGKEHLYDLIYEPRFRRLWGQFRNK